MSAAFAVLEDLEKAISTCSAGRQHEIAAQVTDLFLAGSEPNEQQTALFATVLERLIGKIEARVLVTLGERLANEARAPATIMSRLARHDDIRVAGPILSRHAGLSDVDLIAVGETYAQPYLAAISERETISQPVTDVLVRRGDRTVALKVASNLDARFSEQGFERLSRRAVDDAKLHEVLALRPDLPRHIFCRILMRASEDVRKRMIAAAGAEMHAEIQEVLDRIAGELADQVPAESRYDRATQALLVEYPGGRIPQDAILAFALAGRHEELVAGLSILSGLPITKITQVLADDRRDGVLLLLKALGYGWVSVRTILQRGSGKRMSSQEIVAAGEEFARTPEARARQVLALWRQREASQH
ncbi:MAG: DUF2336 domain-containing protein [Alphaproteobacteria bacterium]|nr:DUF2336 domain-containing protein [Alphaproteobacteria bacterium]